MKSTLPPITFHSRLLDPAAQSLRLSICATCDKNHQGNCTLCRVCGGRPVQHKVRLNTETCPLGKWPPPEALPPPWTAVAERSADTALE